MYDGQDNLEMGMAMFSIGETLELQGNDKEAGHKSVPWVPKICLKRYQDAQESQEAILAHPCRGCCYAEPSWQPHIQEMQLDSCSRGLV